MNVPKQDDKSAPRLELSFFLQHGQMAPIRFRLTGTSTRVTIGRRLDSDLPVSVSSVSYDHCELFLRRKNRDPVLCVRDLSRNQTGVRHPTFVSPNKAWRDLRQDEVEILWHRSEILVPAKQKKGLSTEDSRTKIVVIFDLPDLWCPWTKVGRWDYLERLGEGGLAIVYRAREVGGASKNRWVAIKVSKFANLSASCQQNRHIYALHREARWSMERLHNTADPRYERGGAVLFARYIEDNTGLAAHSSKWDFDGCCRKFEDPRFVWSEHVFDPSLAPRPYVVMELIEGKLLQHVIENGPPLDLFEQRAVVRQCTKALVYMERFDCIHRDFRGCNIFLAGRGPRCQVKTIDFGFMVTADPKHARNPNPAVRCAWQGDPERKLHFDWAPPEVRTKGAPNFGLPPFSFDIFSFGVLLLKLLHGRTWAQDILRCKTAVEQLYAVRRDIEDLGLTVEILISMLDQVHPEKRPLATDILQVLNVSRDARSKADQAVVD